MNEKRVSGILFGVPFTSDKPEIVFDDELTLNALYKTNVRIAEEVKGYKQLGYTTDIDTLKYILNRRTIRSSSLNNAKLNDRMEKMRKGVEQFAGSRFITCFTHMETESVPFWAYYGGKDKTRKVQLVFDNFANKFEELFYLDYLQRDDCKVFFDSDKYTKTINQNGVIGSSIGLPAINTEFDIRSAVKSVSMFDVDYLEADDEVFTADYAGLSNISSNKDSGLRFEDETLELQCYNPSCLGKQKSNPWSYECETRIMLTLDNPKFSEWDYLDLRFKDELFRNMRIILSPWITQEACDDLKQMINNWKVSTEIKESIRIQRSVVDGTLNI